MQVQEVQESYEQAEGLLERVVSLSSTPGNWSLFDQVGDGDKTSAGVDKYEWGYTFDYSRSGSAADVAAYDTPTSIRPRSAAGQVKFLKEVRAFVTHIAVAPVTTPPPNPQPTGLSRVTVTVYHVTAGGSVPTPKQTTKPRGGKLVEMSTYVRRVGN